MYSRAGILACCVLVVASSWPMLANAQIGSCSISLSPQTVDTGSDTSFTFSLYTTDGSPIEWMQVTRPAGGYVSLESASASGWQTDVGSDSATFSGGNVQSGYGIGLSVEALASNTAAGPLTWQVQISDSPDGANPTTCDGDTSFSIVQSQTQITISSLSTTNITSASATISWTTDAAATSEINYGLDSSYGSSTSTDNNLVTRHSIALSGLQADTGYHFQVVSTTPDGGSATSTDNTFLTASPPAVVVTPPTNPTPSQQNTGGSLSNFGVAIKSVATSHVPPIVSITTHLQTPFKQAPTINGTAADVEAVAIIEYSTDGGNNWLPVDKAPNIGGKSTPFSFTPIGLEDGSYVIVVRAIDTSGNMATTLPATLVIDRLDPLIGGNLLSLGPQILAPDQRGIIASLAGVDQKITLSTVGGPTTVVLTAQLTAGHGHTQTFALTRSAGTGLWSGIISFASPGLYNLVSNAIDGAGNKTSQVLTTVDVASPAHTYSQSTHRPVVSTITLYYQEPDSHSWVVWDGADYGQANPQKTDSRGEFKLFLPPGTYYMQAEAAGYNTLVSSIFTTNQTVPLAAALGLKPLGGLSIGSFHLSLPDFSVQKINLLHQTPSGQEYQHSLIGKPAPDFNLGATDGTTVHAADLLGRPTLITLGATWSSSMSEQLAALNNLQVNKDLNILPVALQQSAGAVRAYTSIAGLDLRWLVDPDSTLSQSYGSPSLPTHYFIDRKGIVRHIYIGVLGQKQIEDILSSL
ncbi:MAG TPA: redoxin domain-containing protein [Candidatus Acidoferrum sp.]|nr:redoxin domain-containing protein [Candidatus Acidoferrum sp.]